MNFIWRLRLFIGGELGRLAFIVLPKVEDAEGCTNKAEWALQEGYLLEDVPKDNYSCTNCLSDMVGDNTIKIHRLNVFNSFQCCFVWTSDDIEFLPIS